MYSLEFSVRSSSSRKTLFSSNVYTSIIALSVQLYLHNILISIIYYLHHTFIFTIPLSPSYLYLHQTFISAIPRRNVTHINVILSKCSILFYLLNRLSMLTRLCVQTHIVPKMSEERRRIFLLFDFSKFYQFIIADLTIPKCKLK